MFKEVKQLQCVVLFSLVVGVLVFGHDKTLLSFDEPTGF